ncbi:MAG: hypothetical protein E6I00_07585 [Chloroflexi bacterium]|nr:MAG: hypothetical protein E6I00_07585 [Chloroflexota bacterium]
MPVLAPTEAVLALPALPVVAVLPVVLPVLAPVLSPSESASCLSLPLAVTLSRSSPLPDLPPATSPRESALPSSSFSLDFPEASVVAAALPLALMLTLALPSPLLFALSLAWLFACALVSLLA